MSAPQRSCPISAEADGPSSHCSSDLHMTVPRYLEVEAIHPALRVAAVDAAGSEASTEAAPRRGELWRWLALSALLFLVAESLWGAWIGSRRRYDA